MLVPQMHVGYATYSMALQKNMAYFKYSFDEI